LADAKQIVPLINDDISQLVDPDAPMQSDAPQDEIESAQDSGMLTIVAPPAIDAGSLTISTAALPVSLGGQTAALDFLMAQSGSSPIALAGDAAPVSTGDPTATLDLVMAGSVQWSTLTSSSPPLVVSASATSVVAATLTPAGTTTLVATQAPTTIVASPTLTILTLGEPVEGSTELVMALDNATTLDAEVRPL
jgi:hypothetical protein